MRNEIHSRNIFRYFVMQLILTLIPLSALAAGPLYEFGISGLGGNQTAGVGVSITITGYDSSGNTVPVTGTTTFELIQVSTPIASAYGAWNASPPIISANFSGGIYTGTLTIYRAGINYDVRMDNDTSGFNGPITTNYDFAVNPNTTTLRYLTIMPGETYIPGEDYGSGYGHGGTPADLTAGVATTASVYVTDLWGNRDTTYNGSAVISLLRIDAGASLVNPLSISGGLGTENMTLTVAYSGATPQQLQPSGGTPLALGSSYFNVLANSLDHLAVGSISAIQTAGIPIGAVNVYGCDAYNNMTKGATDLVYLTSTDRFAPSPLPVAINWTTGNAVITNFAFHTASEASQGDAPFIITAHDVMYTIQGVTRTASSTDSLPTSNVVDIVAVTDGITAFVKNFDYRQNGDSVEWLRPLTTPAIGSMYQVRWVYRNPANITSGTSSAIYVNPNAMYGLVTLAPGQALVEGSGNTNMSSGIGGITVGGWYNGVTLTDPTFGEVQDSFAGYTELIGAPFSVTVVATDRFGNEVNSTDTVQLWTNDADPSSVPNVGSYLEGSLVNGRTTFLCWLNNFNTQGNIILYPKDYTNSLMDHSVESRSDILLISVYQTFFKVWVNGVASPGPVALTAAPDTFTMKVEVRDDVSNQIVHTANVNFVIEAILDPMTNTPAGGVLNVSYGQTQNGELTISNQTYSLAETIYLRVKEAGGATRPTVGYSAELNISTSSVTPTATATPTATPVGGNGTQTPMPTVTPTLTPTATPWLPPKQIMNYPNPARDRVNFAYTVSGACQVVIDFYKLTGERVASIKEHVNGGSGQTLTTVWQAAGVAPGIYLARIVITDEQGRILVSEKKKVALVR